MDNRLFLRHKNNLRFYRSVYQGGLVGQSESLQTRILTRLVYAWTKKLIDGTALTDVTDGMFPVNRAITGFVANP